MPPPDSGVVGDHTCRSGQQQEQQGEAQQLAAQDDTTGAAAIAVGPPTTITGNPFFVVISAASVANATSHFRFASRLSEEDPAKAFCEQHILP